VTGFRVCKNKTKPSKASVTAFLDAIDELLGESEKLMRRRYEVR